MTDKPITVNVEFDVGNGPQLVSSYTYPNREEALADLRAKGITEEEFLEAPDFDWTQVHDYVAEEDE